MAYCGTQVSLEDMSLNKAVLYHYSIYSILNGRYVHIGITNLLYLPVMCYHANPLLWYYN